MRQHPHIPVLLFLLIALIAVLPLLAQEPPPEITDEPLPPVTRFITPP